MNHRTPCACNQFDPFSQRPREECTSPRLAREASDVDTAIRSLGPKRLRRQGTELAGHRPAAGPANA